MSDKKCTITQITVVRIDEDGDKYQKFAMTINGKELIQRDLVSKSDLIENIRSYI